MPLKTPIKDPCPWITGTLSIQGSDPTELYTWQHFDLTLYPKHLEDKQEHPPLGIMLKVWEPTKPQLTPGAAYTIDIHMPMLIEDVNIPCRLTFPKAVFEETSTMGSRMFLEFAPAGWVAQRLA